ncbi:hypothetical protein [Streptomyces xiamenensis]|uniref:hypothetical protein n=1 Tax=Streptomyces xiamenensis TaxID=408015 RepID=UPI0035D77E88
MSTTHGPVDLTKETDDDAFTDTPVDSPAVAVFSTMVALLTAIGALVDLFLCGFWDTALHFVVVLVVFSAVRLCVGIALSPRAHLDLPEAPEATP